MDRDGSKTTIYGVLEGMQAFLSQGEHEYISEADTKHYFIDPIIGALGWRDISEVRREYHIRSSQEYIDYVMSISGQKVLAIEAKRLTTPLTEKHAAQLIQYCSIEGIEWSVLTNGREWQVFNTYMRPDLRAKLLFQFELLRSTLDDQYQVAFDQLWLLAREGFPSPIRIWLDKRRIDREIRRCLSNPSSGTIRAVLQDLRSAGVSAAPDDVVVWFRGYLGSRPSPAGTGLTVSETNDPAAMAERFPVSTTTGGTAPPVRDTRIDHMRPTAGGQSSAGSKRYFGVRFAELVHAHILPVGTRLALMARGVVIAHAQVGPDGDIVYAGKSYANPSHPEFAHVLGRQASNGWHDWHAILPEGRLSLSDLRDRYINGRKAN